MSARSLNIHGKYSQGNITVKKWDRKDQVAFTEIKLHGNVIALIDYETRQVEISHAGWKTNTTKVAINNVLSQLGLKSRISQRKFVWYIDVQDVHALELGIRKEIIFDVNLTLNF